MARTALLVALLTLALGAVAGCGGDSDGGDGDPEAFCDQLDRLTRNDPFLAFGDTATAEQIDMAFGALVARSEELLAVAPPEARGAARDYAQASAALAELLDDAGFIGADVDVRAYRAEQVRYAEAAARLQAHLSAGC